MPLFVCEECHTIDNTATGFYWSVGVVFFMDETKNNKALCCACIPEKYSDGSKASKGGEWHGRFEREKFDINKHDPKHYRNVDSEGNILKTRM
jgi:hypothetical protein